MEEQENPIPLPETEEIIVDSSRESRFLEGSIWTVFLIFCAFSLWVSASATINLRGETIRYAAEQACWLGLGAVIMVATRKVPYSVLMLIGKFGFILALITLVLTYALGDEVNGAVRSIRIFGLSIHTFEFLKLFTFFYVANYLGSRKTEIENFQKGVLPLVVRIGIICLGVAFSNVSTALLIGLVCIFMLLIGGVKIRHFLGLAGGVSLILGLLLLITSLTINYTNQCKKTGTTPFSMAKQIESFCYKSRLATVASRLGLTERDLSKEKNVLISQEESAKIAIANGSILGKGPGWSSQRYILSLASSDFAFAILVEESGIAVGIFILILYLALVIHAGRVAMRCSNRYLIILVIGLSIFICLQALVHMAVNTTLFPVTGQTLPFISKGGTSILVCSACFGVVLNVARYTRSKANQEGIAKENEFYESI